MSFLGKTVKVIKKLNEIDQKSVKKSKSWGNVENWEAMGLEPTDRPGYADGKKIPKRLKK